MTKTKKGIGSAVVLAAALGAGFYAGNQMGGERPAVMGEYSVLKMRGGQVVQEVKEHNAVVAVGMRQAWRLFSGDSANHYDTAAFLGVGNSATATDTSMTGLQGATTSIVNVDSLNYGANYIQYFYTFHSADANFSWQEFCLFNDSNKIAFNRATSAVGTKTVADTWILRLRLTMQ